MKAITVIIAGALLASAGLASADDLLRGEYVDNSKGFVSTKTREQVRAELEEARAQGLYSQKEWGEVEPSDIGPRGPAGARPSVSGITREQVRAELEQARKEGKLEQNEYVGK